MRRAVAAKRGFQRCLAGMEERAFREFGRDCLEQTRVRRKLGTPFFVDKLPNNYKHEGLIQLLPKPEFVCRG